MILVSLNICGQGNSPKRDALKKILNIVHPIIILLQKTMFSSFNVCEYFLKIKPLWRCCDLDASGMFGRLLLAWNPAKANFKPFSMVAGLPMEGKVRGID